MSFVKRIIGPDERLIGISTTHWIYGAKGIVWMGGMMFVGLAFQFILINTTDFMRVPAFAILGDYIFWTCAAMGALMFFFHLLIMISTEIALTTKRVIYKRGLIAVDVREVDLEEVKAADVNNGWFGRFLNYGYLLCDARFVTNLQLPAIGNPYRFVKALNEARAHLKSDSVKVILGDVPEKMSGRMESALNKDQQLKKMPPRKARIKDLKPVVFDKVGLRDKVKSSFHMIAHYGNKF